MDALQQDIDATASPDGTVYANLLKSCPLGVLKSRLRKMLEGLEPHASAFDTGIISCRRLVEVLVPPFLKLGQNAILVGQRLGQRLCQSESVQRGGTQNHIFVDWTVLLTKILSTVCDPPLLRPRKRAELVKALIEARFPEVRP